METLRFDDGTAMELTRLPEVDNATWNDVKHYLQKNPQVARSLQTFATEPEALRGWLQTQVIAEHYNVRLTDGDAEVCARIDALKKDPELAPIIESIKKDGLEAALKYCNDEELMQKVSCKMGGIPADLKPKLQTIQNMPFSLHEACKQGDLEKDGKGITSLGYAIGGSHIAIVKMLLASRADPYRVDNKGNTGLHYAAGYGRKELVDFLLRSGIDANKVNLDGQTPLYVASMNKQAATVEILEQYASR